MKEVVLIDTGPLVTFLASGLKHHKWICEQWQRLRPPMFTCEPVLTEAAFLLKREGREADPLLALLEGSGLNSGGGWEPPGAGLETRRSEGGYDRRGNDSQR